MCKMCQIDKFAEDPCLLQFILVSGETVVLTDGAWQPHLFLIAFQNIDK